MSPEQECLAQIIEFINNYKSFVGGNPTNAWTKGFAAGEELMAITIKNIIERHNLKSLAASERVN